MKDNRSKECKCLFNAIIEGESDCLFSEDENDYPESLDQYEMLRDIEDQSYEDDNDIDDMEYSRLAVLSNEIKLIGGKKYHRIISVIDGLRTDRWLKLYDLIPFTVWSNCKDWITNQEYIIFYKDIWYMHSLCPPMFELVNCFIRTCNWEESRVEDSVALKILADPDFAIVHNVCKALKQMFKCFKYFLHDDTRWYTDD